MSHSCPNCEGRTPIAKLAEEETKKIFALFLSAQNAPAIKFTSDPNEKDLSTLAWDEVRNMQIELGKKYGYDHTKIVIMDQGFVYMMTEEEMKKHG